MLLHVCFSFFFSLTSLDLNSLKKGTKSDSYLYLQDLTGTVWRVKGLVGLTVIKQMDSALSIVEGGYSPTIMKISFHSHGKWVGLSLTSFVRDLEQYTLS